MSRIFSDVIEQYWRKQLIEGKLMHTDELFTLVISGNVSVSEQIVLVKMHNGHSIAAVCADSEFANQIAKVEDMSLEIFHSIVKETGLRLSCANELYYFSELEKEDLIEDVEDEIIDREEIRKLLAEDIELLNTFESSLIESGLDSFSLDLEQQILYGVFQNGELIAVAVATQWRQSDEIVDVRSVVLPKYKSKDTLIRLMQMAAYYLFEQGYEFQYRTKSDEKCAETLVKSLGLERFGQWQNALIKQ